MGAIRLLTEEEIEILNRLNEIREGGEINMFGAGPVIQQEFGLDRNEARRIHKLWMQCFNEEGNYEGMEVEDEVQA